MPTRPGRAGELGWRAKTDLRQGLFLSQVWWKDFLTGHTFGELTKKTPVRTGKNSVSAIIACYKDSQAIPIMYERLVKVFTKLGLDYEIIFVNDGSPDNSSEVIAAISERDPQCHWHCPCPKLRVPGSVSQRPGSGHQGSLRPPGR